MPFSPLLQAFYAAEAASRRASTEADQAAHTAEEALADAEEALALQPADDSLLDAVIRRRDLLARAEAKAKAARRSCEAFRDTYAKNHHDELVARRAELLAALADDAIRSQLAPIVDEARRAFDALSKAHAKLVRLGDALETAAGELRDLNQIQGKPPHAPEGLLRRLTLACAVALRGFTDNDPSAEPRAFGLDPFHLILPWSRPGTHLNLTDRMTRALQMQAVEIYLRPAEADAEALHSNRKAA